jgi:hypothetical protein
MDTAIDRIMHTYDLMVSRTQAANDEARARVTGYIQSLFDGGEKDPHRLTVFGLTYLRELDGSNDPVKAGFTGLYWRYNRHSGARGQSPSEPGIPTCSAKNISRFRVRVRLTPPAPRNDVNGTPLRRLRLPAILDRPPHPLRGHRHVQLLDAVVAERIDHRVDHHRQAAGAAGLAAALGAQRV